MRFDSYHTRAESSVGHRGFFITPITRFDFATSSIRVILISYFSFAKEFAIGRSRWPGRLITTFVKYVIGHLFYIGETIHIFESIVVKFP